MPDLNFDSSHVFYYMAKVADLEATTHQSAYGWERVTRSRSFVVVAANREAAAKAVLRSFGSDVTVLAIMQLSGSASGADVIIDQDLVPAVPAPAPREP